MSIRKVLEVSRESVIMGGGDMSAPTQGMAVLIDASELSGKMGISMETLSRAARADTGDWATSPTQIQWQQSLRPIADLWRDLSATFGGEENARLFLSVRRPELMDQAPLYYLERGEPQIVQNLVDAMREMLP
jgi:hypothetical protein